MINKRIYEKVAELIKEHETRDPDELIKRLNIKLSYIKATKSLLGMYKIILKNRYIFIPQNLGALRSTVLAHEIGHDQLHREECLKGKSFHENAIFDPSSQYELEANIFAAHLLIPDEGVLKMMQYARSDRELATELGVDLKLLHLKISEMAKMELLPPPEHGWEKPDSNFLKYYKPPGEDWD